MTGVWERLACYDGGTVADLSAAPERDGRLTIFAATPAGVYRSSDIGRSWCSSGPAGALPFVTSVAPSPAFAEDRTVFAGTLAGLFRSRDGGDSWRPVLAGGAILAVAVSPSYPDDHTVFVGTADDGILRSEDGGDRWISANAGLLDLSVQTLTLSERFHEDGFAFAGTDSGLYRSRNGGQSWQEVDLGLDEVSVQAIGIGPGLTVASWIAVATEEHGLLLSDDSGKTWFEVLDFAGQSIAAVTTWATPSGDLGIDVATGRSILRSVDGGVSWRPVGAPPAPVLTLLSIMPVSSSASATVAPDTLAGLVGDGVLHISATGQEPALSNDGLDATVLTMLALSPNIAEDDTLFAASADGTLLASRDRGRTLARLTPPLDEPSVTGLAVSPSYGGDRTVWISTVDTLLRSRDAGGTWAALSFDLPAGASDDETGDSVPRLLAVACEDGRAVLFVAAGCHVGRSDDGGERWRWLGAIDDNQEVVGVVAVPRQHAELLLYAATRPAADPGRVGAQTVWRSTDGGQRWERWLDIETESPSADVVLLGWDGPPSEPNLLVAIGGTVYLPRTDARERRGRATRPLWRAVEVGPGVSRISGLATPDGPAAGRIIFAGTNAGVFVSRDGGRSFEPWHEGLEGAAVQTVAVAPDYSISRDIFAVGPGGIWRRQDR